MRILLYLGLGLALLACSGGRPDFPARQDEASGDRPAAPRALSSYLRNLSPVLEGVTAGNATLEHLSIPTSDGTVLDGYVRRPPGDTDQPAVIVFTPYYGGGSPDFAGNALGDPAARFAQFLIPRGYAVGFVSVGGTGNSGGCFRDGGPVERQQLYDAVEFIAAQPWRSSSGCRCTFSSRRLQPCTRRPGLSRSSSSRL